MVEHAKSYVQGNGLDPSTTIGPLVSETQRQTVHSHVVAAQQAGARCVLGGTLPPVGQKGTFYPPTVLADVPHSAKAITQEETFGPVVALSKVKPRHRHITAPSPPHIRPVTAMPSPRVTVRPWFSPKFDGSDDAAVKLANDSTYGLTASVYSADLLRAGRIASLISAGQVGFNSNSPALPWTLIVTLTLTLTTDTDPRLSP